MTKQRIILREEAKKLGQTWYFTGKPCKHGHIAKRNMVDRSCSRCKSVSRAARRKYLRQTDETERFKHNAYSRAQYWGDTNRRTRSAELHQERKIRDPDYMGNRRAYSRKRKKENPEPSRADTRNRRARLRNSEGSHTANDVSRILVLQRNLCAYCRVSLSSGYHVDHIKPVSQGGSNWPKNLQCLCGDCNRRKSDKDPLTFARENGLLL